MNVKNAIVQGENYRFTVLTPSMIRMEYSEKGVFVDKKTQMVVNRTFDVPEYTVNEKNGELIIETDKARLVYTGGRFAGNNLRIEQRNQKVIYESTWHYGDTGHNLQWNLAICLIKCTSGSTAGRSVFHGRLGCYL